MMRGISALGPAAGIRPAWSARRSRDRARSSTMRRTGSGSASPPRAARSRRRRNDRPASAALTARSCATPRRNRRDRPRAGRHSRCRRACLRRRGRAYRPQRFRRRARPAPATAHGWCRRWSRRSHGSRSPRGRSACRSRRSGGSRARCRRGAWNRSIAGRLEDRRWPRAREIDCSSGRRCSGVASSASTTSASTPTPLRAHFRALRPPRIEPIPNMAILLDFANIIEYSVSQSI